MRTTRIGSPLINPPRFKPTRDRHIKVIDVACPTCSAEPKQHCRRLDGQPSVGHLQHPSRRRMAIRAENAAKEAS